MEWLKFIVLYLPAFLAALKAVEDVLGHLPGPIKKEIAIDVVRANNTIPEEHLPSIGTMVDTIVGVLNRTGVFQKKSTDGGNQASRVSANGGPAATPTAT